MSFLQDIMNFRKFKTIYGSLGKNLKYLLLYLFIADIIHVAMGYSEIIEYRLKMYKGLKKSVALLYTNEIWTKKETNETKPFTIATSNIKYFGSNCNQVNESLV